MTIRVFTAITDLPEAVRRQLSYPVEPEFFLSLDWFELLFETCLSATHRMRVYVSLDGNNRVRCSLFCGVPNDSCRTLVSLTNFYSLHFGPGFPLRVHDPQAWAALADYIAGERPRWDSLSLTMLPDGDVSTSVVEVLAHRRFATKRYFQYENWYAPIGGASFEAYFAQRPSQLRNTVTRKQKKLEKQHKLELLFAKPGSSGHERLVTDFVAIYGASWKQPEPFPEFIPALAGRCFELGILRLGVLYVDGEAAAAQLWITTGKKALIYKLAYDEKFGQHGVGSVLSKELFRMAIDEDQVDEIDYGVGSEPYKKDWMTEVRQIRGLEAYNARSPKGLMLGVWSRVKEALKQLRTTPSVKEAGP